MRGHFVTAVEITDSHIKIVQALTQRASGILVYCDAKEIKEASDDAIAKDLAAMFKTAKLRTHEFIGIVPRRFAILRHISLPSHRDDEIKKMVSLQAPKQVPYPKEDVILDYTVLEKETSGYSKILMIATHKDVVSRYLKIFQDAGLPLNKLTISSEGLLQWMLYRTADLKTLDGRPTMVVHVDTVNTEICFCHQQKLIFSRNINFGARDLNEDHIASFVEQIALTFASYIKENIGEEVSRIVLVSGASEIALLEERLEKEYKANLTCLNPLENIPQKRDLKIPLSPSHQYVSFAVGAGLVLSHHKKFVDLLPVELSRKRKIQRQQKELARFLFAIFVVLILLISSFAVKIYKNAMYLHKLEETLNDTKPKVEKVGDLIKRLEFIQERLSPSLSVVDIIQELYNLMPTDVSLSTFYLDENGGLTLQGVSASSTNVNILQKNLVGSPLFQNVTLQYATKRKVFKGELTDFKIVCQVKKSG